MLSIKVLDDELSRKVSSKILGQFLEISDGKNLCVISKKFVDFKLEKVKNFKVYEDDIWVVTFPKCGTTWAQEMVRLISTDLDYERASKINLDVDFPYLE